MRRPIPFVVIIGDTSGSMQGDDLRLVRGVVEDICYSLGARVAFLATDADVHGGVQIVQDGKSVELLGRGGTDMVVGMDYAMKNLRPRPDVMVVVTDCETGWPTLKPRIKTIVCGVGGAEDADAPQRSQLRDDGEVSRCFAGAPPSSRRAATARPRACASTSCGAARGRCRRPASRASRVDRTG